jgi:hypothetical protein
MVLVDPIAALGRDVARIAGQRVARVFRIFYAFKGDVDRRCGALEIHFASGDVLLLDGQSDGESLALAWEPWTDPFAPPLSPENRAFVDQHGQWTRVDVSTEVPYRALVDDAIQSADLLHNPFGTIAGLALHAGAGQLWFWIGVDESMVSEALPDGFSIQDVRPART